MKRILVYIFTGLFAFALIGCKKEDDLAVNQSNIFSEYELYYDGKENKTYATARFKHNNSAGAVLKLKSLSTVTFEGNQLVYDQTLDLYKFTIGGEVTEGTFIWSDGNDFRYINKVSLNKIRLPAADTIVRTQDFYLSWLGKELEPGENLSVIISGNGIEAPQMFSQEDGGATSVTLTTEKLVNLSPGITEVFADRFSTREAAQHTSAGGLISAKYRAYTSFYYLR
jgi:hypothetical protein